MSETNYSLSKLTLSRMIVPETLKNYSYFIEHLPIGDRLSYTSVNDQVLEHILNSNDGKLILKKGMGDKVEFFSPKPEDISNCFLSGVWDLAKLEDKIKIINMYTDYFFGNEPCKPKLLMISNDARLHNQNILGSFMPDINRVFINLDNLSNAPGLKLLKILYHEFTHVKDFYRIENDVIPSLLTTYHGISDEKVETWKASKSCIKAIMDMKIMGNLHNYKTGHDEHISNKLCNDILRAKNFITPIFPAHIGEEIFTTADFSNYVDFMLYYFCPIERLARISVRQFFKPKLTDKNAYTHQDYNFISNQVDEELFVDDELKYFEKSLSALGETLTSKKELLDLKLKRDFYNNSFVFSPSGKRLRYPLEAEQYGNEYSQMIYNMFKFYKINKRDEKNEKSI